MKSGRWEEGEHTLSAFVFHALWNHKVTDSSKALFVLSRHLSCKHSWTCLHISYFHCCSVSGFCITLFCIILLNWSFSTSIYVFITFFFSFTYHVFPSSFFSNLHPQNHLTAVAQWFKYFSHLSLFLTCNFFCFDSDDPSIYALNWKPSVLVSRRWIGNHRAGLWQSLSSFSSVYDNIQSQRTTPPPN